jgi:hypothetical protein
VIHRLPESKHQHYCNEPSPMISKSRKKKYREKKPQSQLYFNKFDCSLFKQGEKYVTLSETLILFYNPLLLNFTTKK